MTVRQIQTCIAVTWYKTRWSPSSAAPSCSGRYYRCSSHLRLADGPVSSGEGWHNNHHAFPRSAFHGLHWWQFDLSGYFIWTLEHLGLASDVYRASPTLRARFAAGGKDVASRTGAPAIRDEVPTHV